MSPDTISDYLTGGTPALENDWRQGFSSMSTGQQVALIGGPVVAGCALVAAEYVGPAYAAYELGGAAAGAFGPEVDDLLGDEEAVCPDVASTNFGKAIEDLNASLKNGDGTWKLESAHAENAVANPYQGGTSIEEVFQNESNGNKIVRHSIYDSEGNILHQTYRNYAKFGSRKYG